MPWSFTGTHTASTTSICVETFAWKYFFVKLEPTVFAFGLNSSQGTLAMRVIVYVPAFLYGWWRTSRSCPPPALNLVPSPRSHDTTLDLASMHSLSTRLATAL